MIYDVKCEPILQVSNEEPSMSSKTPTQDFSAKSCPILMKLLDRSLRQKKIIYGIINHLELNIKDYVVGFHGAYPESLVMIGHDLAEKA